MIPFFSGTGPYGFKEQAGINLVFATLITESKKWRGVRVTPTIQLQLTKMSQQRYAPPPPTSLKEVVTVASRTNRTRSGDSPHPTLDP